MRLSHGPIRLHERLHDCKPLIWGGSVDYRNTQIFVSILSLAYYGSASGEFRKSDRRKSAGESLILLYVSPLFFSNLFVIKELG